MRIAAKEKRPSGALGPCLLLLALTALLTWQVFDPSMQLFDRDTGAQQVIEAAGYPYLYAIGLADLGLAP